ENSSVNMADEMVNMIEAQRAFQLNARVVQTADQIDEMVNNLR
ncbi:MAG: flagellar basal body rod C-terminal domain-containing protein, partial [Oscillospiraceae bacterium]